MTLDVTQFPSYGQALIATTSSAMPNVIWQNTSSGATYSSASNIVTAEGKVLKRTGATYT